MSNQREEVKKTNRGFGIYSEFKDSYGNQITVQESSNAMRHCCWIFVKDEQGRDFHEHNGEIHTPSAHLTKAQAKRLIKALTRFVNHE